MSILELQIRALTGKILVPEQLDAYVASKGFTSLAFTSSHANAVRELTGLDRHDPFDRALLAQAKVERLTLVTADRRLLESGGDLVTDATV